ncbi:MAG: hypothetical protein ACRD2A_20980, partial [Vicinamibacterales bacterium]
MEQFRKPLTVAAASVTLALAAATPSSAVFLDEARLFKLTANFYTQERLAVSDTDAPEVIRGGGMTPEAAVRMGQLIQLRNYANPVFEGNLSKFFDLTFLDDISFRFAGRFVYDGVYDFGTNQFGTQEHLYRRSGRFISENLPTGNRLGGLSPAPIYQGTARVEVNDTIGACGDPTNPPFFAATCEIANAAQRDARDRDMEFFDPRKELATQADP